ncbi:uncharacterized protein B0H18DRAFT_38525 [Fomitopsis serialis]|uniref:uncharacterized protein n=1 Tax=Fomitopsis serialis TaxID=139415 RepID=UPI002008A0DC|nr:uncharacterized protein B0H18DRAFT_38525 [Neoantrodia serialis]KAH9917326.1 hypothetical protein B0H18DRAFT_38525 [Neoantrodia serialis]
MEPPTSQIELPPELWDYIIEESSSDRSALRACGLTQRAWVATTRRHLFKAIELKGAAGCEQFLDIILSSSSIDTGITQCVCDVTLTKVRLRLDALDDREASDIPLIEEMLSRLPNIDCLRLVAVDVKCGPRKMHADDGLDEESSEKTLRPLFTLPKLRALHLMSIVFDSPSDTMRLLAAFPQASSLQLKHVLYLPTRQPRPATSVGKAGHTMCIQELSFAALTDTVGLLGALRRPPFKFKFALQKLICALFSSLDEVPVLLEVIGESESTLEELEVHCGPKSDLFEKMDLSRHSRLKSLRVAVMGMMDIDSAALHPSLSPLLSRTPSSLRALHLPVDLSLSPDGTPPWQFMDWPSLDEALTLLHEKSALDRLRASLLRSAEGYQPLAAGGAATGIADTLRSAFRTACPSGCGRIHSWTWSRVCAGGVPLALDTNERARQWSLLICLVVGCMLLQGFNIQF